MNSPVDNHQDPDSLEREVNSRRANLNQTLGAVEKRLSPNHLMEQTIEYIGEHGGDIAHSVNRFVKDNPLPLILTGVGISWLIASQSGPGSHRHANPYYRQRLTHWDDDHRSAASTDPYARTNQPVGDRSAQ